VRHGGCSRYELDGLFADAIDGDRRQRDRLAAFGGTVYALNPLTGAEIWAQPFKLRDDAISLALSSGVLYVGRAGLQAVRARLEVVSARRGGCRARDA
jgi:outer membrane protein assembly factor BamB